MSIRTTGVRYDVIARDSASKVFKSVGDKAGRLDSGLGKLAKTAAYAGAAIAGGLAVGLAVSAEKAVKFEASMKKIQTQAGATAGDVKVLSAQVLELGKSTQQGPEKLSEALYHLKSVGMDNVDAMKALKTSSDLAAVGGSDLEATTNALAGAWRTGIKGANSFADSAKTVNAIIGAGNMTMEDMVAALGTGILPTAKTFGLTFAQVGGALALFTDEGIDSASAATRLRMSISLLAAPSRASEKQLKKIGLTGNMLGEAMRGPKGIIGAISLLSDHLDKSGLSATKQAALLSRAFGGGKSSSAILSMVNNLDVLEKKQAQINASMGKYGPAVEAQRKTAQAQLHLIESNLQVLSIKTGNVLLPPLTSFVTYINTDAIPAAGKFTRKLRDLVPVGEIKAGFAETTGFIGDFFGGLFPKNKAPVITLPTPTIKRPSSPIPNDLRSPDLIVPSPTLKVGTTKIPSTLKAPPAVISQGRQLGDRLRGVISGGIGDAVGKIDWSKLGGQLGDGLGKAVDWLVVHIADVTKKLEKGFAKVDWVDVGKSVGGQALGFSIGFMTSMGGELFKPSFWSHHWWDVIIAALSVVGVGKLSGPIGKIFEKIPVLKAAAPMLKGISRLTKPVADAFSTVSRFFGRSLWKGLARVFPDATTLLERESGLFTTRIGVWRIRLVEAGGRAIRGLGNGIAKGFGWVVAKVGEGIGYIIKPFASAGSWLIGRGSAVVGGLRTGVARGAVRLGGWVTDHVISPATRVFRGAGSWLLGRGSAMVSGLKSGAASGARGLGGWAKTNIINKATSAFTTAGRWLRGAGGSLVGGLKSGVVDGVKGIGKWLKSALVDPVVSAVKHYFGIRSPSRVFAGIGGHLVSGLMKGLARSNGLDIAKTVFGDLPSALAGLVGKGLVSIERLPGKALSALAGVGGAAKGLLDKVFGGGHNDLVGQWATDVRAVLGMLGASPEALSPVLSRIRMESGGNPNAINLTDSNAKAGHPSQGLMQCVSVTTKILTRRGWLSHDEVQVGDETLGYNPASGRSQWTRITKVVHYENAPVWRVGHRGWHADVTPNHRWWSDTEVVTSAATASTCLECGYGSSPKGVSTHRGRVHGIRAERVTSHRGEFVRTEDFSSHHRIRLAAPADTDGIVGFSCDEAAIIAWLQGDGHIRPAGNGMVDGTIYQSKPAMVIKIRALLSSVEHTEVVRERGANTMPQHVFRLRRAYMTELLKRSGLLSHDDPETFVLALSPDQRAAWLGAMIDAEGHRQPGKKPGHAEFVRIAQVDGLLQNAIRLAVFLEGFRPTHSALSAERNGYQPSGLVGMARPHVAPSSFHDPEVLPHQTVWCVKTDLETWTAELDGQVFLTGNTIPGTFNTYAGPFRSRGITDPLASIYAGVNYAMHRYGKNWVKVMTRPGGYAAGGLAPIGQTAWVGERGPELMQVTRNGTRIISTRDSLALAKGAGIKLPGYAKGTVSLGEARRDVTAAQRQVAALERQIAALRHDEATAHSRRQRKADQLAVMAAEQRLKAARTELTAAKKTLTTAQAQAKRVQGIANTLQNGFLKSLETGTAAGIASAVKSMNSKLQAAGAGGMVAGNLRTSSKLQSLASQRAGIASRIAAARQYSSDQAASLGDYLSVGSTSAVTLGGLMGQMKAGQQTAGKFAGEVAGLSKRGLNKNLLGQLADAGPGSQLAGLLAHATTGQIAQLNKLAASQSKLTVSFGKSMADSMYDSGAQAGKGFLTGLQAQEDAIQKELDRLAAGMVDAIKKKLGIHSPSRVFRDQVGKQVVLGVAAGVRIHAPRATAQVQRMADTMAAVRARSARPSGWQGGAGPVHHTVNNHYETHLHGAHQTTAEQAADVARLIAFTG